MQSYDLVVIGSGPGGQRAAIQAAKSGKRVAVIEKREAVGGVCINTGTIPSKTMREAVLHLSGFYYQNFYGANFRVKETVTMAELELPRAAGDRKRSLGDPGSTAPQWSGPTAWSRKFSGRASGAGGKRQRPQ